MLIRQIREEDAEQSLRLFEKLCEETDFLLFEPGERKRSIEEEREWIRNILASGHSMIFVVEHEGELVGMLGAIGSSVRRQKHRAHVMVGILQKYTGQGIGTKLFQQLEQWAREKGLARLELTVMTHNLTAIGLYAKMGFSIEGTRRRSLVVNGKYVDEYYMGKQL
jgi:RimJ/RimL family protein N-acetyltransferase